MYGFGSFYSLVYQLILESKHLPRLYDNVTPMWSPIS